MTPKFLVSSIYYKLYYFDINANGGEFGWVGRVHWFALKEQKFMSEYEGNCE